MDIYDEYEYLLENDDLLDDDIIDQVVDAAKDTKYGNNLNKALSKTIFPKIGEKISLAMTNGKLRSAVVHGEKKAFDKYPEMKEHIKTYNYFQIQPSPNGEIGVVADIKWDNTRRPKINAWIKIVNIHLEEWVKQEDKNSRARYYLAIKDNIIVLNASVKK